MPGRRQSSEKLIMMRKAIHDCITISELKMTIEAADLRSLARDFQYTKLLLPIRMGIQGHHFYVSYYPSDLAAVLKELGAEYVPVSIPHYRKLYLQSQKIAPK